MQKSGIDFLKNVNGVFIDDAAIIEEGVCIYPNCYIIGKCKIGKNSVIYSGTTIENSVIGENCTVKSSFIEDSVVDNNVQIGPFAHLRPNSKISEGCKIGNFVEIKNATIGSGSKVSHLAYVGDADIGSDCNIGCGAIFVNYNGRNKNRTIVGDNCFIGSNCNIIAPVDIKRNTYICAGTTLTIDTKEDDFVIGRARETIKNNRAHNYLKEMK